MTKKGTTRTVKEITDELLNAVFPDDKDDYVEHIDLSYKEFVALINELSYIAWMYEDLQD